MDRRSKHGDDDDAFDEHGIIKDGRSVRVPMMMRDSLTPLQRAVAADAAGRDLVRPLAGPSDNVIETYSPAMVVDGFGNGGLALHQPGYRYLHAGHRSVDHAELVTAEAIRAQAREDYIRMTCDAWRGPGEGR
jgi:hypothetical protein